MDHFGWRGRGHIGPTLDHIGPDEIRFKNPSFFSRPASKSNGSSRTGVEGAGPLANERRRRNFSRFALRHARSHLGPGPALPKLALDHSSPPQNGRPWTTLGDIGPTLDRVVQGWTNAEIAALTAIWPSTVSQRPGARRVVPDSSALRLQRHRNASPVVSFLTPLNASESPRLPPNSRQA